jgi:excisionase family DNA binding protein
MAGRPTGAEGAQSVDERWFTVEQIAERLQVTGQSVRRWIRDGQLIAHAFGGKAGWRIKESDLDKFLKSRRASAENR